MTLRVFLDTEFLPTLSGPRFISAAFLTEHGLELYSEVTSEEAETLLHAEPNEFVRANVVSQLGCLPGVPWADLPRALTTWLDALGDDDVEVIYDFSSDFLLVEQMLQAHGVPLKIRLHPTHVGYLLDDDEGKKAAAGAWEVVKVARGLGRHHALADSFALKSRFEAVHPAAPATWVPADFPRSCVGALSGVQPKVAARFIAGEFVEGPTKDEHRARYDACLRMAEQLVEYSHRKRTQLEHLTLKEFMRRVRASVARKGWGFDARELTWVMQRVTLALGGTAADVPLQEVPKAEPWSLTTTASPVESLVDRALRRDMG